MKTHVFALLCLITSGVAIGQAVERRSYAAKNCPECKKGEKAITVSQPVGPGDYVHVKDPSCQGDFNGKLKDFFRQLASAHIPGIDRYAGPLLDSAAKGAATFFKKHAGGGDLGSAISQWTDPTAQCALVLVFVPIKAVVTGMRLVGESPTPANGHPSTGKCEPSVDCPIGWAKWDSYPTDRRSGDARVIQGVFKNWSDNLPRVAKLTVYYKYNGPELR